MGQYFLHQWLLVDHLRDTARNVPGQEIEPLIDIIINEVERFLLSSKEQVCYSRALNDEKIKDRSSKYSKGTNNFHNFPLEARLTLTQVGF